MNIKKIKKIKKESAFAGFFCNKKEITVYI